MIQPTIQNWLRLAALCLLLCGYRGPGYAARAAAPPAKSPADISDTALTSADLEFGRQQEDQMLRDLNAMRPYARKGDRVYEWVARQFAGDALGERINWSTDLSNFPLEYLSRHSPPAGPARGYIAIRERYAEGPLLGQRIPGDKLWFCLVFEMYNISDTPRFTAVYHQALSGKVTRSDFIEQMTRTEFDAIQKTARFHQDIWRDWARQMGQTTDGAAWFADTPTKYEKWIGQYTDPNSYPNSYWGKYYDEEIVPYRRSAEASR